MTYIGCSDGDCCLGILSRLTEFDARLSGHHLVEEWLRVVQPFESRFLIVNLLGMQQRSSHSSFLCLQSSDTEMTSENLSTRKAAAS